MLPIRVVIADDHEVVRYGLRTVVAAQEDIRTVGEAANGTQAVQMVRDFHPDVLLLDLRMPEMDGLEVCREIRDISPATKVLVLTTFDDDDDVFGAVGAGASGYVMKDIRPKALMRTIRDVAEGQTVLDEKIAGRVLCGRTESDEAARRYDLSDREREVLNLMAQGLNNKEVAESLWIGEATVKTHVSSVLHKLGTSHRMQAVVTAMREGLVEMPREVA